MRKLYAFLAVIALLLLVCPGRVQSQVSSYNFTQSTGTYSVLSSATSIFATLTDDAVSSSITLPFTFTYSGTAYTNLMISTNGFLTLGNATTPGSTVYAPISNTGIAYNTAISAFSRDLVTTVKYQTLGFSPE